MQTDDPGVLLIGVGDVGATPSVGVARRTGDRSSLIGDRSVVAASVVALAVGIRRAAP
jgi:hypothetical protein